MPKGHRSSRSQGYYRLSPTTPTSTQPQYSPHPLNTRTAALPNTYYPSPIDNAMSSSQGQQSYQNNTYSNGGPVQHPSLPLQSNYSMAPQVQTPSSSSIPMASIRPSSGAWSPADDQALMLARSQGMNWQPIQSAYFPAKSANACRKRHERLMERRNQDDWDGMKLEGLAKYYMDMRREIWSGLAEVTGEKWSVVEQKCMTLGLKNLQSQSRSYSRRERLLDPTMSSVPLTSTSSSYPPQTSSQNPYTNISSNGYNPTPAHSHSHSTSSAIYTPTPSHPSDDDLDYENSLSHAQAQSQNHHNNTAPSPDRSVSSISYGYLPSNGGGGHSHSSSGGSSGSRGGMNNWGLNGTTVGPLGGMGIEAIINRPGGHGH